MQTANIFIHIVAGTLALVIGLVPYFTAKGSRRHRSFGQLYVLLMGVVLVTAYIGVAFFRSRPFLVVVTVLATYSTLSGQRALRYREKGPSFLDLGIALTTASVGVAFLLLPQTNVLWHASVVYYLVGFMFCYCSYDLLRFFRVITGNRLWIFEHALKMTSSYAALFSAAVGTVLAAWEPWNQIGPAILSTALYIYVILYLFKHKASQSKVGVGKQ